MAIPLTQTPQLNGTASAPSPASSHATPLVWEHDKMWAGRVACAAVSPGLSASPRRLNVYILDYFQKRGFAKSARELVEEAEIERKPPIDARQGLLYECVSLRRAPVSAR